MFVNLKLIWMCLILALFAKLIISNFHPLEVVSDAIHYFKWVKIIEIRKKMKVSYSEILLIEVTFYLFIALWGGNQTTEVAVLLSTSTKPLPDRRQRGYTDIDREWFRTWNHSCRCQCEEESIGQRCRQWADIKPTLVQRLVFAAGM